MRKIYISETQKKFIFESLINDSNEENDFFPIKPLFTLSKKDDVYIKERYENIKKYLSKYNISGKHNDIANRLSAILSECHKIENAQKESIEKICHDAIVEMFSIETDFVSLSCEIVNHIDSTNTKIHISPQKDDEYEFNDTDEIDYMGNEIEKRYILNALIIGISLVLTKYILRRYKNKINNINPKLYHLYNELLWLNEYYMYVAENIKINHEKPNQIGSVEVKLGNDFNKTIINSKALILPILIYETLKGLFELFISHGLPESKHEAIYVIDQSDLLQNEPYCMVIGPIMWNKLSTSMNESEDSSVLPYLLTEISILSHAELRELFRETFLNTKKGKTLLNNLISNIKNEIEYSDFEDRLSSKRKEKDMMFDSEYMSREELLDEEYISINDVINHETVIPDGMINSIPNEMGINLCSVDGFDIERQNDGQIETIKIKFLPDNKK